MSMNKLTDILISFPSTNNEGNSNIYFKRTRLKYISLLYMLNMKTNILVYVHTCIYAYIHIYVHAHTHTHVYMCVCV